MFNYVIGTRDRHIFLRLNFQIKKSVAICLTIHLFGSKIKNRAVIILKFFIVGTGGDVGALWSCDHVIVFQISFSSNISTFLLNNLTLYFS